MSNNKHWSLLFREVDVFSLRTRLTDILCIILFILGVIGNVLGLIIFSLSCRSRHKSSVYVCLATCSSITNLLCVIRYASILHSTSREILRELVAHKWWACKFYEFSFSFRIISSWIILFWMFERLICISKRLRTFFNRWHSYKLKFFLPIIIIVLILSCVIGPAVYMYQPTIILDHDTIDSTKRHCEVNANASMKWQKYFHEVHPGMNYSTIRCISSELIPTGAILLFNSKIIYHVVQRYLRLHRSNKLTKHPRQLRTASWMNVVLVLHSSLFLSSLFFHILGHFLNIEAHETWWISLTILVNYSSNFYVYCLSGKAFRNEIHRLIQYFKRQFR